jgi:hypothetical protein
MNQLPSNLPKRKGREKRDALIRFRTYRSIKEQAQTEARLRRISVGKLFIDALLKIAPSPRRSPVAEAIRAEGRLLVGISQQLAECQRLLRRRDPDLDVATLLWCQIEIEQLVAHLVDLCEARLQHSPANAKEEDRA